LGFTIEAKKRKALATLFIIATLLIAASFFPSGVTAFESSSAFGWDPVHQWITDRGIGFIRDDILDVIKHQNWIQDTTYKDYARQHFCQSLFNESASYINEEYAAIIADVSQEVPDVWDACERFGMGLHTVQDFYAHSNWVEIWTKRGWYNCDNDGRTTSDRPPYYLLFEPGLDYWFVPGYWEIYPYTYDPLHVQDTHVRDIIIAQTIPSEDRLYRPTYISNPYFNTSAPLPFSRVPTVDGRRYTYDALVTTADGCTYRYFDMDHSIINKDNSERPYYEIAYWNAVEQTNHEWIRLLNLTKGSDYRGSSAILGYWWNPAWPCVPGYGSEAITATVSITSLTVRNYDYNIPLGFAFVVYTGDLMKCRKSESDRIFPSSEGVIASNKFPASRTLTMSSSDTLVIAVEPWVDMSPGGGFNSNPTAQWGVSGLDRDWPLSGCILLLSDSNLHSGTYAFNSASLDVEVTVSLTPEPTPTPTPTDNSTLLFPTLMKSPLNPTIPFNPFPIVYVPFNESEPGNPSQESPSSTEQPLGILEFLQDLPLPIEIIAVVVVVCVVLPLIALILKKRRR
jgi:hypothetical protein